MLCTPVPMRSRREEFSLVSHLFDFISTSSCLALTQSSISVAKTSNTGIYQPTLDGGLFKVGDQMVFEQLMLVEQAALNGTV